MTDRVGFCSASVANMCAVRDLARRATATGQVLRRSVPSGGESPTGRPDAQ